MPQIVWTATPGGTPDYYNEKWHEYTGVPGDELPSWHGILHPEDMKRTREAWLRSLAAGESCELEYRLRGRDGGFRWHLGRAAPIRNAAGEIIHWFATCTDIDDLKRAEADLATHRDELADQTVRLRKALNDRDILFKEVHHRVKNNLQVISSLVNLQAKRVEDPVASVALVDTNHRVYSIALVHEVLYGGHEATELDMGLYLARLCEHLSEAHAAGERGLSFEVEGTGSLELVRAVPLGLIANELLTNALKHAFPTPGTGRIRVRFTAGAECRLVVGDDGIGMRDDAHAARSGNLGMMIITGLVDQLKGEIRRSDAPGTEWRVTFPA